MLIIVFFISMPLTYLAVKLLYPQYLNDSIKLILPICISAAFGTVTSVVKAILMKYIESKKLVTSYILYIIVLLISATLMSYSFGIIGFAYATAHISLWIMFIFILNKATKKGENNGTK